MKTAYLRKAVGKRHARKDKHLLKNAFDLQRSHCWDAMAHQRPNEGLTRQASQVKQCAGNSLGNLLPHARLAQRVHNVQGLVPPSGDGGGLNNGARSEREDNGQ